MKYAEFLGIKPMEGTNDTFIFQVDKQHLNEHDTLHGGVLYSICSEAVARYVTNVQKRQGVGAEGSIHYYRAAQCGEELIVKVLPRKTGKRMSIFLIEIKNAEEQLIADSMFTVAHV